VFLFIRVRFLASGLLALTTGSGILLAFMEHGAKNA